MAKLDIRTENQEEIDTIVVEDNLELLNDRGSYIEIYETDEDIVIAISMDNIDNLIKGLKKAKELWTKE